MINKRTCFAIAAFSFIVLCSLRNSFASETEFSATRIFKQQADSIVLVGVMDGRESRLGTGFIISEDGVIVTSDHVVRGAQKIFIKLSKRQICHDVKVISHDKKHDIAFLKINLDHLKVVSLGNSDSLQIGQRVVAIGNPLGLEDTISDGLISAVRQINSQLKLLQISVPLSSGSSGSPLFNLQGEVIGVVNGSYLKGQALNFAVPINEVRMLFKKFVKNDEVKKDERKSFSGYAGVEYTKEKYSIYVVKAGDTLYRLARKFNTTAIAIMKLNKLTSSKIYRGQKIKIPSLIDNH